MSIKSLNEDGLTVPIALHWAVQQSEHPLIEQLREELSLERQKTSVLESEIAQLKENSRHIEQYLSSFYISIPSSPKLSAYHPNTSSGIIPKNDSIFPKVGSYPSQIRAQKIQRYKQKIQKYRKSVQISRKFAGRSKAARNKNRDRGKFVKKS
jgi:hypothetical protein